MAKAKGGAASSQKVSFGKKVTGKARKSYGPKEKLIKLKQLMVGNYQRAINHLHQLHKNHNSKNHKDRN